MKQKARFFILLGLLFAGLLVSAAGAEGITAAHQVNNSYTDTKNKNKSVVRLWQVETANEDVTGEVNGIARAWAEEKGCQGLLWKPLIFLV